MIPVRWQAGLARAGPEQAANAAPSSTLCAAARAPVPRALAIRRMVAPCLGCSSAPISSPHCAPTRPAHGSQTKLFLTNCARESRPAELVRECENLQRDLDASRRPCIGAPESATRDRLVPAAEHEMRKSTCDKKETAAALRLCGPLRHLKKTNPRLGASAASRGSKPSSTLLQRVATAARRLRGKQELRQRHAEPTKTKLRSLRKLQEKLRCVFPTFRAPSLSPRHQSRRSSCPGASARRPRPRP